MYFFYICNRTFHKMIVKMYSLFIIRVILCRKRNKELYIVISMNKREVNYYMVAVYLSLVLAILSGVYVSFTARGKGPILTNSYLILNKEERKKADKKAEYKLLTVVFSFITIIFLLIALAAYTGWVWPRVIMWICTGAELIYVMFEAVKSYK